MAGSITAFIGGNGDGKTLGAVAQHVMPALAKGRHVAATFDIYTPGTRDFAPNTERLCPENGGWRRLLQLSNTLIVLDEINSEFPARQSMSLPPELLRLLHQMRKPRNDVVWTAVNWSRADVALREATKVVTVANSYLPDKWARTPERAPLFPPSGRKLTDDKGKPVRLDDEWPPARLFRYRSYNAQAFDEFTVHTMSKLRPIKTSWYFRPWHNDQYAYDTEQQVPLLDNLTDRGTCIICGGKISQARCTCTTGTRTLARERAVVPAAHETSEHAEHEPSE